MKWFLSLGNNPDFKAGVLALANLLKIQRHDDYLVMLKVSMVQCANSMRNKSKSSAFKLKFCCCFLSSQAIRILIQERLTPDAIAKASQAKEVRHLTNKHSKNSKIVKYYYKFTQLFCNVFFFFQMWLLLWWKSRIFSCHYSSLQCHMIFQKPFKYADLVLN